MHEAFAADALLHLVHAGGDRVEVRDLARFESAELDQFLRGNGRLANIPDPNNRRFYPDHSLQPIYVYDPKTGEQNIPIYPFNPNNVTPLPGQMPTEYGTPVLENVMGYQMRYTQWLTQWIGADGFRIDAAKNMPSWVLNYYDRAVYRESNRSLLNGAQRNVFAFSEVYDSSTSVLNPSEAA